MKDICIFCGKEIDRDPSPDSISIHSKCRNKFHRRTKRFKTMLIEAWRSSTGEFAYKCKDCGKLVWVKMWEIKSADLHPYCEWCKEERRLERLRTQRKSSSETKLKIKKPCLPRECFCRRALVRYHLSPLVPEEVQDLFSLELLKEFPSRTALKKTIREVNEIYEEQKREYWRQLFYASPKYRWVESCEQIFDKNSLVVKDIGLVKRSIERLQITSTAIYCLFNEARAALLDYATSDNASAEHIQILGRVTEEDEDEDEQQ